MATSTPKLTGQDLLALGFAKDKCLGIALRLLAEHYSTISLEAQKQLLGQVLSNSAEFLQHEVLAPLAEALTEPKQPTMIPLHNQSMKYSVYGEASIQAGAIKQMVTAMPLRVTVTGALMQDAHQGYGLPTGRACNYYK